MNTLCGRSLLFCVLSSLLAVAAQAAPASDYPVAGLAPHERPAGAPRVNTDLPVDTTRALHGVPAPRPAGLEFVEGQGGWYTPFTRPGMTGRYDLRGWHTQSAGKGEAK